MCKVQIKNAAQANPKLLASLESFCGEKNKGLPDKKSMIFTGGFVLLFLVMVELTLRQIFTYFQVSFYVAG